MADCDGAAAGQPAAARSCWETGVPNYLTQGFYPTADKEEFLKGIRHSIRHLGMPEHGVYASDNLFTFGRNLSFLDDEALMAAFREHATTRLEQVILWRTSIVVWAARQGMRLDGDFIECACYKGTTARIVYDCANLAAHPGRRYFLYDMFEHDPANPHHAVPGGGEMGEWVTGRFAAMPNVIVSRGKVPEVLHRAAPEKIAFMHLDLNSAEAELAALEVLFERMVPGAVLLLDDYGWADYRGQKLVEDPWLEKRGYRVMELPTGQGMVIR
jgi:hypothetical protein